MVAPSCVRSEGASGVPAPPTCGVVVRPCNVMECIGSGVGVGEGRVQKRGGIDGSCVIFLDGYVRSSAQW